MNFFHYHESNGFEIRFCRTNNSTFNAIKPEDHLFEIRIRHENPEIIQALNEKIKEWIE